jgi:hypothetical protein
MTHIRTFYGHEGQTASLPDGLVTEAAGEEAPDETWTHDELDQYADINGIADWDAKAKKADKIARIQEG